MLQGIAAVNKRLSSGGVLTGSTVQCVHDVRTVSVKCIIKTVKDIPQEFSSPPYRVSTTFANIGLC